MSQKVTRYWNQFYKNINLTLKHTSFAKFAYDRVKHKKFIIYDVGCGNGRDTIFFNKKKIKCFGLDKSSIATKKIGRKFKKFKNLFLNKNFCTFFNKQIDKDFVIYSRFTLHTINYIDEKKFLANLKKQKKLKFIFIETRTLKDDFYGLGKKVGTHEFISSHYRRFIDPADIKKKLRKFSQIIYFKEAKNFAKFKNENPWILRIVAKVK